MRILLRLVCGFTILASTWLTTMYFFLQHPGYEQRAAISAGFVLAGLITLASLQLARPPAWLQALVAIGAIALIYEGSSAINAVLRPNAHFEGYALVIGAALAVQGVLTLVVIGMSRPIGPRTSDASEPARTERGSWGPASEARQGDRGGEAPRSKIRKTSAS